MENTLQFLCNLQFLQVCQASKKYSVELPFRLEGERGFLKTLERRILAKLGIADPYLAR